MKMFYEIRYVIVSEKMSFNIDERQYLFYILANLAHQNSLAGIATQKNKLQNHITNVKLLNTTSMDEVQPVILEKILLAYHISDLRIEPKLSKWFKGLQMKRWRLMP